MQQTAVKTEKDGSSIPRLEAQGTPAANVLSDLDRINLSLNFVGIRDGRYIFRYKNAPMKLLTGDRDAYVGWKAAHEKQARIIDAEREQVERLLAQGREYERTGDRRAFTGGIVVGS